MTPDEVQKVLRQPTFLADLAKVCGEKCDEGAALELNDYELNGQHFMVRFWFAKPDMRLHAVSMFVKQLDKENGNEVFAKMKQFLEISDGPPRSVNLIRGFFIVDWALPSSIITLRSNATDAMTIVYEENTEEKENGKP